MSEVSVDKDLTGNLSCEFKLSGTGQKGGDATIKIDYKFFIDFYSFHKQENVKIKVLEGSKMVTGYLDVDGVLYEDAEYTKQNITIEIDGEYEYEHEDITFTMEGEYTLKTDPSKNPPELILDKNYVNINGNRSNVNISSSYEWNTDDVNYWVDISITNGVTSTDYKMWEGATIDGMFSVSANPCKFQDFGLRPVIDQVVAVDGTELTEAQYSSVNCKLQHDNSIFVYGEGNDKYINVNLEGANETYSYSVSGKFALCELGKTLTTGNFKITPVSITITRQHEEGEVPPPVVTVDSYHYQWSDERDFSGLNEDTIYVLGNRDITFTLVNSVLTSSVETGVDLDIPETSEIEDGRSLKDNPENIEGGLVDMGVFSYMPLTTFDSTLEQLKNGTELFNNCTKLETFSTGNGTNKLPVLTDGTSMFNFCEAMTTFNTEMPVLTNATSMFNNCSLLKGFYTEVASLTNATSMFNGCSSIETIQTDMSKVTAATNMLNGCSALKTWDGSLASLVDGKNLFKSAQGSLETVNSDLSSMKDGEDMFRSFAVLSTFEGNLKSLTNGNSMFRNCENFTTFDADVPVLDTAEFMFSSTKIPSWNENGSDNRNLSNLTDGYAMFYYCIELEEFSGNLINLINGGYMFDKCFKLTAFEGDLSKLENGYQMFARNGLLTFSTPTLKSLTNAEGMFRAEEDGPPHPLQTFTVEDGDMNAVTTGKHMFQFCSSLQSFTGNLASMIQGTAMFQACTSLQSFTCGDLGSLQDGNYMFHNCSSLTDFNANLPELTNSDNMFEGCTALATVSTEMPKLTTAKQLFKNCSNLTNVKAEMPIVTNATEMLNGCSSLQTWEGSLAKLVDAKDLFKSAQLTLKTVTTDLSSMVDGTQMFNNFTNLRYYSGPLTQMEVGTEMFASTNVVLFEGVDLSSLKVAPRMFSNNKTLERFACDLPELTNSAYDNENLANITNWKPASIAYAKNGFFNHCESLKSFSGDLSKLVSGYKMFVNCYKLGSFDAGTDGLKSLECGALMFMNCGDKVADGEKKFTTFSADLSALKDGYGMFWGIDSLTSFKAGTYGLKSLQRGVNMFSNCTLDGTSVEHILTTIPIYTETPIEPNINQANYEPVDENSGKGYLQLGLHQDAAETFVNLYSTVTGVTPVLGTDGVYSVDGNGWMDFKGWKLAARING